jgi:hypothetical protein
MRPLLSGGNHGGTHGVDHVVRDGGGQAGRRPRRALQLAAGAFFVVALVACQSNNIPSSYGDVTKASFLGTCTGTGVAAANGTTTSIASSSQCECSYAVFVDMVPFDDNAAKDPKFASYQAAPYHPTYNQLNTDLKDDPNKITQLPDPVQTALKSCATVKENVTPGSTPGSTPNGTTVGTAPGSTSGSTPGTTSGP